MTPLWLTNLARRAAGWFGSVSSGFPDEWQLLPALIVDDAGFLVGQGVQHIVSHPSWHYPTLLTKTGRPSAIVAHNSATKPGTARNMARRRTHKFGSDPDDRAASWHVSVEADGTIIQQVSFLSGCWHVGSDTAKRIKGAGWGNRVAVGVELIGFDATKWPEAQMVGAARLWRALVEAYGIERSLAMVPHSDIDPKRKTDPGKGFMREWAPQILEYAYAA